MWFTLNQTDYHTTSILYGPVQSTEFRGVNVTYPLPAQRYLGDLS